MRSFGLMALLALGTVAGFGSGFASMARHRRAAWHSGCHEAGHSAAPRAPASQPMAPAPSTTIVVIGGSVPQGPQVVTLPAAPAPVP
jgi:hypothetical protein